MFQIYVILRCTYDILYTFAQLETRDAIHLLWDAVKALSLCSISVIRTFKYEPAMRSQSLTLRLVKEESLVIILV